LRTTSVLILAVGRNVRGIVGGAIDVRYAARSIGSTFWHVVTVILLHVKIVEDIEFEVV
jgi:hypothetical protein